MWQLGTKFLPILLAAVAGSLMAIQGTINSVLGKTIGKVESTLSVQLIGALTIGLIWIFFKDGDFSKAGSAPWYAWLGGPIGVAIIFGVVVSIPKLGVGVATTAIIAAQLLTAYSIDHFGLFGMQTIPFNLYKLAGIIFIVTGAKILLH